MTTSQKVFDEYKKFLYFKNKTTGELLIENSQSEITFSLEYKSPLFENIKLMITFGGYKLSNQLQKNCWAGNSTENIVVKDNVGEKQVPNYSFNLLDTLGEDKTYLQGLSEEDITNFNSIINGETKINSIYDIKVQDDSNSQEKRKMLLNMVYGNTAENGGVATVLFISHLIDNHLDSFSMEKVLTNEVTA
tara:strand:+ start:3270 stop:3842 length:573 start_codon:yes stop_codon:yes gene_type:complete